VVLGGLFYVYGKKLESKPQPQTPPSITVTGEGKVSSSPDIAELSFGVQTGRKVTSKDAIASLKKSMDAVIAAVKAQGIDAKDIKTEQFYLSPEYDWSSGQQSLRGYGASEMLSVKVRDLDKVGDVLGAATSAGANSANGVNFTIDEPEEVQAQAREEAIKQAKERARVIANQLGMKLGKVTSFSEGGGYYPPVYMRSYAGAEKAMDAVTNQAIPVEPGQQEIRTQVTITYELE
jgi:uncharacterized protein YggE